MSHLYDRIGDGYAAVRREEPRDRRGDPRGARRRAHRASTSARARAATSRATATSSPSSRRRVMLAQRPIGAAPAVQASAEALPFADGAFDAAMAVLSDHHWPDRARRAARAAPRRAAPRRRVPVRPRRAGRRVLARARLPARRSARPSMTIERDRRPPRRRRGSSRSRSRTTAATASCSAYWRRPRAYLDTRVRDGISVFRLLPPADVEDAVERLRADLESGEWARRNAAILERDAMDLGYRLVIADYGADRARAANSSTSRASAAAPPAVSISMSVTSVGTPAGALVGDEAVDQPVVRAAIAGRARARCPARSQNAVGRALEHLAADERADTATTGAGAAAQRLAHPGHGEDRADRDHRVRRADHDRLARPRSPRAPRGGARALAARAARRPRPGPARASTDHELLERPPAPGARAPTCAPARRVIGSTRARHAERLAAPRRAPRSAARPRRSRRARTQAHREVAVAEAEPDVLAELAQRRP